MCTKYNLHDIKGEKRKNIFSKFSSLPAFEIEFLWPISNMIVYNAWIWKKVGKLSFVCTYFSSFIIKKNNVTRCFDKCYCMNICTSLKNRQNVCWIPAWSKQSKGKIRKGTRVFFLSSGLGSFPISRQLKQRYFLPSLLVFLLFVYHVHARLHSVAGGRSGTKSDDSKTAWYSSFLLFHACGYVYRLYTVYQGHTQ